MTQEDKELLLKYLCMALPYGVICYDNRHGSGRVTNIDITPDDIEQKNGQVVVYYFDFDEYGELKNCKPYLRPMSSMTEDEFKIYHELVGAMFGTSILINLPILEDFLLKNHFDFMGLIPKGLALKAPKDMY